MKFAIFINPQIPVESDAQRRELAPVGRNTERYQAMLQEFREIAVLGDQLGFDAFMCTEHHFHSEGFEASVNPLMLMTDLIARTERITLASLGMVLNAWDPVRAAEDVAMIDQLSKGRFALGVARGYQQRWASTLFQTKNASQVDYSDAEADARNQDVFGEMLKIMKMCWSEETVRYQSEILNGYSIPSPFDGIKNWPPIDFTREFGGEGEIDDEGAVRRVSVVPRPYQDPHPPLWQPFAVSERTVRRCAELDIMPYILAPRFEDLYVRQEQYRESAAAAGHDYAHGEHTGCIYYSMIGDPAEQIEIGNKYLVPDWDRFFGAFGYREILRLPGDTWAPGQVPSSACNMDRFQKTGTVMLGTPDDVKRQISELQEKCNPEYFCYAISGLQGLAPLDYIKDQMELFATKVMPEFQ